MKTFLVTHNQTVCETWTPLFDRSGKYELSVKYEITSSTDNVMIEFFLNLLL
jgi:hypothetical protein